MYIHVSCCLSTSAAEVGFDPTTYSYNEDVGTATLTIVANRLNLNGAVEYYTQDGTAVGQVGEGMFDPQELIVNTRRVRVRVRVTYFAY